LIYTATLLDIKNATPVFNHVLIIITANTTFLVYVNDSIVCAHCVTQVHSIQACGVVSLENAAFPK